MTAWNTDMAERPEGRPILLKLNGAPVGWAIGGGEHVTIGQVGNGMKPGIWTSDGFFPDEPAKHDLGSAVFKAWAEVPA